MFQDLFERGICLMIQEQGKYFKHGNGNTIPSIFFLLEDEIGGTPMPVGVAVAPTLPDALTSLVPEHFDAEYYLFVTNSVGSKRIALFAVGAARRASTSE